MYIPREIEGTIDSMLAQGKVVLVTGARQVGKTTVLRQHLSSSFDYVSLENPKDYVAAREMPSSSLTITACRSLSTRYSAFQSCSAPSSTSSISRTGEARWY
ncbi:AAA family ATPase [Actinomyces sp. MRS3W]|uniref:AAA family ATPase n=1 Tax=Actinomyces sp. MRS3W TaxID=2800796 RepID=UPI0028FCFFC3|nr:AAA family ATPase [Actinomyces sp. MRS3W]MDU0347705.1 AAA family ATPase [Actinomyces sp. MRS3W]